MKHLYRAGTLLGLAAVLAVGCSVEASPEESATRTFSSYMHALEAGDDAAIAELLSPEARLRAAASGGGSVEAGIAQRIGKEREAYRKVLGDLSLLDPEASSFELLPGGDVARVVFESDGHVFDPLYFVLEDGIYKLNGSVAPETPSASPAWTNLCGYGGLHSGFYVRNRTAYSVDVVCGSPYDTSCNNGATVASGTAVNMSCAHTCGWWMGSNFWSDSAYNIAMCGDWWLGDDASIIYGEGIGALFIDCTIDC